MKFVDSLQILCRFCVDFENLQEFLVDLENLQRIYKDLFVIYKEFTKKLLIYIIENSNNKESIKNIRMKFVSSCAGCCILCPMWLMWLQLWHSSFQLILSIGDPIHQSDYVKSRSGGPYTTLYFSPCLVKGCQYSKSVLLQ